jgi:putative salt-induced outer membrane protein YdiY
MKTETALTTALTSVFSIKNSFIWKHVSQPPPNAVKDDTIVAVALIANF